VLLFSDGNLPPRANFDLSFKLDYQRLAAGGPNMGITALSAQRSVAGGWDVFAQIEGTAETEGNGTLELWDGEERVAQERFTLVKGRAQRMVFRFGGEKAAALRVQLVPDAFDSLTADNVAQLDLPAMRPLRVYVPSALTTYRRALRGMNGVVVSDDAAGDFDLAISDQTNDVAVVARTRLWVGMAPAELDGMVSNGTNATQVVDWRRDSPLLQHVELSDLLVQDDPTWAGGARESDFENAGFEVLAYGEHGPLIAEKNADDAHTIALLFHTDRSTLPYRVGFPILVANVVQSAMQREGLAEAHGARSLLSPTETSLASIDQLQFNEKLSVAAAGAPLKIDRPLWKWMLFTALGLLIGEWWYFNRKPGGFQ
jgi:Ca-activated chloride channel family protein